MAELEIGKRIKLDGKEYLVVGKTFGSAERMKPLDRFTIESEQANIEETAAGPRLSLWVPEVIEPTDAAPDSLAAIVKRAREHGVLREKRRGEGGELEYLPNDSGKPATASKSLYDTPPTGAMVALFPDARFAKKLVAVLDLEGKADPDELHVTLVYLGEAKEVEDPLKVLDVMEGLALETEPLTARIGGVGLFSKEDEEGRRPLYAAIDCPGLAALRTELVERLEKAGVEIESEHDFTPHMTLAYVEPDMDLAGIELPEREFKFPDLVLGLGGKYQSVPFGLVAEKQNILLTYPPESKTWRFVAQEHFRGKSAHLDLRFEAGDYLVGWTVPNQVPGAIKEPVTTLAQAKDALGDPDLWKMDMHTGVIKPRQIRGGTVRRGDLRAMPKGTEIPEAWLEVEGVTEEADPGEEPAVGATRNYPGVFAIVDKGTVEFGAQKPWVHEAFVHGKKWGDQRWLFRLLGREGKADVLPEGVEEEQPRESTFWVLLQPEDSTPYVLSSEAVSKEWLPPKGVSALPRAIRSKIPKELRYWEASGKPALKRRRRIVEELDVRELAGTETKQAPEWRPYLLQRHWWRGPIQVRFGASEQHHDLRVKLNGKHWHLVVDGDPLTNDRLPAYEETKYSGSVTTADGKKINVMKIGKGEVELAPGQPANPTKDTPAWIETVDEGRARFLSNSPEFKKLEFEGGKLGGVWAFRLEEAGGEIGEFGKEEAGPNVKDYPFASLSDDKLLSELETRLTQANYPLPLRVRRKL